MEKSVNIDERKYKSILKINKLLLFTNKSFFYTILGFTQSHSYPLNDILAKNEILKELKTAKDNDLENLVYRMHLTFAEVRDFLNLKFFPQKEWATL